MYLFVLLEKDNCRKFNEIIVSSTLLHIVTIQVLKGLSPSGGVRFSFRFTLCI